MSDESDLLCSNLCSVSYCCVTLANYFISLCLRVFFFFSIPKGQMIIIGLASEIVARNVC